MSAAYEDFKRVPTGCGKLSKIEYIGTPRWLKKAFGIFETDASKGRVLVLGHLASLLAAKGLQTTGAPSEVTLRILREWWLAEREGDKAQGIFVEAKLDPRIAREATRLGRTEESLLVPAFHHAVGQLAARSYPGSTLGWMALDGLKDGHAQLYALFFPVTSDGRPVGFEGRKSDSAEASAGDLQTLFSGAVRSRFIAMTKPPEVDADTRKFAAIQWILLCRHAMPSGIPEGDILMSEATSRLDHFLGSPGYSKALNEGIQEAEGFFFMQKEDAKVPDPGGIRGRWDEIIEEWEVKRKAHMKVATETIQAHLSHRAPTLGYQPIRGIHTKPTPPAEVEYLNLAVGASSKAPPSIRTALKARMAVSAELSTSNLASRAVYEESLAKTTLETDKLMYRMGYGLATIELLCATARRHRPGFIKADEQYASDTKRLVRSKAWSQSHAEHGLNVAAKNEAEAHSPGGPADITPLLAIQHHVRFPTLEEPSQVGAGEDREE